MVRADAGGSVIDVRVIPRAGRSALAGVRNGAVLVRLAAAPVDGAANDELLAVLARALGVPLRSLTLVSGVRARTKRVRVDGLAPAVIHQRLDLPP
ncbi:MAG: DUF167 domain-containing protein [Acidobacteriota bacterium]